ncbi:MAG TPA: endonuclease/exonuclease/phosphatase family protein [Acidimicrobiales bacterium]|nr:endonuclease/exonuclease/phosphatase family protein [Acidimicrobiales bacterium]
MPPVWWRRASQAAVIAAPWLWFLVRDATPAMEPVAVTLPVLAAAYAAVNLGVFVVTNRRFHAAAAASTVGFAFVAILTPWLPHDGEPPAGRGVSIVVANVLGDNDETEDLAAAILGQSPDIVVAPESTRALHEVLRVAYPHVVRKDVNHAVIGIYSRYPVDPEQRPGLLAETRQWRIEVDGPDERFVLWAVHLSKPWFVGTRNHQMRPWGHAEKLDEFIAEWDAETLPVVVAGDTNLTDRGRGYRRVLDHGFRDALRGIGGGPTARKWYLRPLFLRVDHVFVPEDWCAADGTRFALPGSDHRGVSVRVGACED